MEIIGASSIATPARPAVSDGRNRFGAPIRWTIALGALATLFVIGIVWFSLDSGLRQYRERAAITSRNTNRLVAETIAGEIERIDLALRAMIAANPGGGTYQARAGVDNV